MDENENTEARAAYEAKWSVDDDTPPGWGAIDNKLSEFYGEAEPLAHLAVPMDTRVTFGGPDILDGLSIYESDISTPHFHTVTYGLSELYYAPEYAGAEYSKYGIELTIRVRRGASDTKDSAMWTVNVLRNIANYVHRSGNFLDEGHYMPANGPIRAEFDTDLQALMFVRDKQLGKIDTPHGEVKFLQAVGLTMDEYEAIRDGNLAVEAMTDTLQSVEPLLTNDLTRKSTL